MPLAWRYPGKSSPPRYWLKGQDTQLVPNLGMVRIWKTPRIRRRIPIHPFRSGREAPRRLGLLLRLYIRHAVCQEMQARDCLMLAGIAPNLLTGSLFLCYRIASIAAKWGAVTPLLWLMVLKRSAGTRERRPDLAESYITEEMRAALPSGSGPLPSTGRSHQTASTGTKNTRRRPGLEASSHHLTSTPSLTMSMSSGCGVRRRARRVPPSPALAL